MAALMIGAKAFERLYRERSEALHELAKELPDRPTASDIHDLRVTARRLQVMGRLLPRRMRGSPATARFETSLKSVLKATSQLRDLDTLLETLGPYRKTLSQDVFDRLENQRSDAAARAGVASSLLVDVPAPSPAASGMRGKKLSRRLRKSIRKHGREASGLLERVAQDESRVAELHALRKEVKKLRYLCELADDTPRELEVLAKWQDSLGAVHDVDVALEFVRGSSDELRGMAATQMERARHTNYAKFLEEYRVDSVETIRKSKMLAVGSILPTY